MCTSTNSEVDNRWLLGQLIMRCTPCVTSQCMSEVQYVVHMKGLGLGQKTQKLLNLVLLEAFTIECYDEISSSLAIVVTNKLI